METTTIVAGSGIITALVVFCIEIYKSLFAKENEERLAIIPSVAMIVGAIWAVIAYKYAPQALPEGLDTLTVILWGASLGGTAVCVNQAAKQHDKVKQQKKENKKEKDNQE